MSLTPVDSEIIATGFAKLNHAGAQFKGTFEAFVNEEIRECMSLPPETPKDELPLWSPAQYRDDYVDTEHFLNAWATGYDVDETTLTLEEMRALVQSTGLAALFYTSPSSTLSDPRWRLIVRASHWLPQEYYEEAWWAIHAALPERLRAAIATNSRNCARGWYMPRSTGHLELVSGTFFDVSALQPGTARKKLAGETQATRRKPGSVHSPVAIDVTSAEGLRRIDMAREYLRRAEPAVQGKKGSDALFLVALHLVRRLELPVEPTCLELVRDIYNPRCSPAWQDFEILHKLEDARDKSDMMTGIFSATWLKHIESSPPRAQPKTGHEYTFAPGIDPAATDMKKTPALEITALLAGKTCWKGVLQWDEFRRAVVAVNPPLKMDAESGAGISDEDISGVRMYFQHIGLSSSKDDIMDALKHAARCCPFHPIKDYLVGCVRQPGILDMLSSRIFGTTSPHADMFLRKTLISAVRRILNPGCQVDTVLVIQGLQGERKSTFIPTLFGAEFTRSQMPDLTNKDASAALQGMWAVELAELDRVLRAETSTVKEFITRRVDDYRPAYGRTEIHAPRQSIFIGTCNVDSFLRDATGNRRFWPISVETVDLEFVRENRDAIWGEALWLAEQGEPHWLTREEELAVEGEREPFIEFDPWHEPIRAYLQGKNRVTVNDVFEGAIARGVQDRSKYGRAEQMRVADTLRRLGCRKIKSHGVMQWAVPGTSGNLVSPEVSPQKAK